MIVNEANVQEELEEVRLLLHASGVGKDLGVNIVQVYPTKSSLVT